MNSNIMSFSKAKLKRFNEVTVVDSPCSERKEHIKKFLKDIRESGKDCLKDKDKDKDIKNPSTPSSSDTESVKSTKSSFFRTPSLPRRLKFRHTSSDSTPKKELQKDLQKGKEALNAAHVEIKNKTDTLQDYQSQLQKFKTEIQQLKETNEKQKTEYDQNVQIKDEQIEKLTKELDEMKETNTKLKENEKQLLEQTKQLENEIKLLLKSHENEIKFLINKSNELEMERDKLKSENENISDKNSNLQKQIEILNNEMNAIKSELQTNDEKLQQKNFNIEKLSSENYNLLDEIESLKTQIEEKLQSYTKESENMLKELGELRMEKTKLSTELTNRQELIVALQEELSDKDIELDTYRDNLKTSYEEDMTNLTKKYEQQITTLKELNDMKVKEMESIHVLEISKMIRDHQDQIKSLEERTKDEIERAQQTAEEKIRISEIQHEQRIKTLEKSLEEAVSREKHLWSSEMDKCQKIAEAEIIQYELEKQDLKTLLESANEMLRERDDKIRMLESKLTNGIDYYIQVNEQLEIQLNDMKQECARIMTEKYNYQLTLNNTRSTANILMERLRKSDSDVEILKTELEAVNNSKTELIAKNNQLENDLRNLRNELDEYKNALQILRNSSQALEREMKEKEVIFQKLMTSEEETLETVNKIGKLFNERIEENIDKYFEMYVDLKRKYESREIYIKDMKTLLDEFATGIELARIELDTKEKLITKLENENKSIKLDNMTLKYRCEQFEKYQHQSQQQQQQHQNTIKNCANCATNVNDVVVVDKPSEKDLTNPMNRIMENSNDNNQHNGNNNNDDDGGNVGDGDGCDDDDSMIDKHIIDNVLKNLNNDLNNIDDCDKIFSTTTTTTTAAVAAIGTKPQDTNKLIEENKKLKTTLSEQIRRNDLLQEMIELESENASENAKLKKQIEETNEALKNAEKLAKEVEEKYNSLINQTSNIKINENVKESNNQQKNKIIQVQVVTKDQELSSNNLHENVLNVVTPTRNNMRGSTKIPHPKTPSTTTGPRTPKTPKTPRTPKTPKSLLLASMYPGKENLSPKSKNLLDDIKSPSKGVLKPRN